MCAVGARIGFDAASAPRRRGRRLTERWGMAVGNRAPAWTLRG